jgi:cobaltochelatase CobN
VLVTAAGMEWYGLLDGSAHYDALVEWARACLAAGTALPAPSSLAGHRFERFGSDDEN